jgi:hypothetical protein
MKEPSKRNRRSCSVRSLVKAVLYRRWAVCRRWKQWKDSGWHARQRKRVLPVSSEAT